MTRACVSTEDLARLLDGELTENRAGSVREHLETCGACRREFRSLEALVRDIAAPVTPRPGALDRLMARLDEAPPAAPRDRWKAFAGGALALAMGAAAIALVPRTMGRPVTPSAVTARGGEAERSLRRDVGVSLYRGSRRLEALRAGDEVRMDTPYAVAAVNLGESDSAHLMVFAQDAGHDLHWIEPAWVDPSQDPPGVSLAHSTRATPPSAAIVLDHPAPGELHVFVLVTPRPVRVSEVEALAAAPLDAGALRARWPEGVVDETVLRVAASGGEGAR
jgi:hypothetical protein